MNYLAVFARLPVIAEVKTRLAQSVGDQFALELYQAFVEDTLDLCGSLSEVRSELWLTGGDSEERRAWAAERSLMLREQVEGALDTRICAAIKYGLGRADSVIVMGSDSPTLPKKILERALEELMHHDLVIGPSADGGYYLIGCRGDVPCLNSVRWSTPHVLKDTIAQNRERNISLLTPWYDIDDIEDLRLARLHLELDEELASRTRRLLL